MSITLTAESKNVAEMRGIYKPGTGWEYDDPNITYDGATDIDGRQVLYDGIGTQASFSAESKNSVTLTAETKS